MTDLIPNKLRVVKRTGDVVEFNKEKIAIAIGKAFLAVESPSDLNASSSIHEKVEALAESVYQVFVKRLGVSGSVVQIEEIQDQVELALMRAGEQKVARAYVIYREKRSNERANENANQHPEIQVVLSDGRSVPLDLSKIEAELSEAAKGLTGISVADVQRSCAQPLQWRKSLGYSHHVNDGCPHTH